MFQGGDSVELLAAGGKDPAAPWKLTGKVRREYDKLSKVFLFTMEGSALATKMTLPKDSTKSLGLTQRYVVLQTTIPAAAAISVEVGVTDTNGTRRRVVMSSAFRGAVVHQLHAQIPLQQVTRDTWLNWCFDVAALVDGSFAKTFRTIDSICLSGTCKLRRVFTMKEPPIPSDHPFDFVGGVDIPRAFAVPGAVTEYFAAKAAAPSAPTAESKQVAGADKQSRDKPKTPRPTSSTKSAGAAAANGKPLSAGRKASTPGTTRAPSSRCTSSRGRITTPPKEIVRVHEPVSSAPQATPLRPASAHSTHIQARLRIQPAAAAPPSSSLFRFAFSERPAVSDPPVVANPPSDGITQRRFESKFQSWEDDLSPEKPAPPASASTLSRPTIAVAAIPLDEPLPSKNASIKSSRSKAELTARELVKELSLDESPFFRDLASPVAAINNMAWVDEDCHEGSGGDPAPPQPSIARQDNQQQEAVLSSARSAIQRLDFTEKKATKSLFQWAPQSPLKPATPPRRTAAPEPDVADFFVGSMGGPEASQLCEQENEDAEHLEPQDDAQSLLVHQSQPTDAKGPLCDQNNSEDDQDDDDELNFDMTKDLQEQSFDFTDALEESLPSMVQMSSPVKRPTSSRQPHAYVPPTARSIVDPRIQSLLESTDWSQPPPMDLVYDPILDCYHDPQSNKYYQLK